MTEQHVETTTLKIRNTSYYYHHTRQLRYHSLIARETHPIGYDQENRKVKTGITYKDSETHNSIPPKAEKDLKFRKPLCILLWYMVISDKQKSHGKPTKANFVVNIVLNPELDVGSDINLNPALVKEFLITLYANTMQFSVQNWC